MGAEKGYRGPAPGLDKNEGFAFVSPIKFVILILNSGKDQMVRVWSYSPGPSVRMKIGLTAIDPKQPSWR